jgi:hypothetical protein
MPKKKRINKAYRTYLFKKRMIEIINLLLTFGNCCYFCKKPFKISDFPLKGKDKLNIHHISYEPEIKVLAHESCHKKFHAKHKKKSL